MLNKYAKLLMAVFLLLGGLMGVLFGGVLALFIAQPSAIRPNTSLTPLPNPAVRTVTVTIDPTDKDELFTELENFAHQWNYAILIAPTQTDEKEYVVSLYRIDMKIKGSYFADSGLLKFGFYNTKPTSQYPQSFFDDELKDFKRLIDEIPDSSYSVQK